jgi:hypothetical protein
MKKRTENAGRIGGGNMGRIKRREMPQKVGEGELERDRLVELGDEVSCLKWEPKKNTQIPD